MKGKVDVAGSSLELEHHGDVVVKAGACRHSDQGSYHWSWYMKGYVDAAGLSLEPK